MTSLAGNSTWLVQFSYVPDHGRGRVRDSLGSVTVAFGPEGIEATHTSLKAQRIMEVLRLDAGLAGQVIARLFVRSMTCTAHYLLAGRKFEFSMDPLSRIEARISEM